MGEKNHATTAQDAQQFAAAKIMSVSEVRKAQSQQQGQLTATQYFDASSKQYQADHEFKEGSLYRQQLSEVETQNNFAKKQITFMKSLRFGYIREKFFTMRKSPQVARKARILLYVLPGLFGLMAATSHYIS